MPNAGTESRSANSSLAAGDRGTSTNRSRIETKWSKLSQPAANREFNHHSLWHARTDSLHQRLWGETPGYEEHEIWANRIWNHHSRSRTSGRDMRPLSTICFVILNRTRKARGKPVSRRAASLVAWSNQAIFNEQGEIVEIFIRWHHPI